MLLLRVLAESKNYYRNIMTKFKRIRMKHPLHVDIIRKGECIYILSLDDGFSTAFVYQAYCKAKENGFNVDLLYAKHIEPEHLPEEVRKMGEKWSQRRLDKREIMYLKNISITEHILRR